MAEYVPISQIIKDLKLLLINKTQVKVAEELGISPAHLSGMLSKSKSPGPKVLEALGYDPEPRYRRKPAGAGKEI